jgi:hypothetical protein
MCIPHWQPRSWRYTCCSSYGLYSAPRSRHRPVLRWLHLGSMIWGMLIEILPWNCPLTWAENWLEAGAGVTPYQGGFLLHYLDALVYPNVPPGLLIGFGVAVCFVNLGNLCRAFPPAAARWLVEGLEERRRCCHRLRSSLRRRQCPRRCSRWPVFR